VNLLGMAEELKPEESLPLNFRVNRANSNRLSKTCKRKYVTLRKEKTRKAIVFPKSFQEEAYELLGDEIFVSTTPVMIYLKGHKDSVNIPTRSLRYQGRDQYTFFFMLPKEHEHLIPWESAYLPFFVYDNRINISLRYLIDAETTKPVKFR